MFVNDPGLLGDLRYQTRDPQWKPYQQRRRRVIELTPQTEGGLLWQRLKEVLFGKRGAYAS